MVCRKGRRLIMVITGSNRLITIITVRPFITPLRHIASVKKHRVIGTKKIFPHLSNEAIFAHEYILHYIVTFLHLQLHARLSYGSTISFKCLLITQQNHDMFDRLWGVQEIFCTSLLLTFTLSCFWPTWVNLTQIQGVCRPKICKV